MKVLMNKKFCLIDVHENDEPGVLATNFGKQEGIDEDLVKILEKEIENHIEKIIENETFERFDYRKTENESLNNTDELSKLKTMGSLKFWNSDSFEFKNSIRNARSFSPDKKHKIPKEKLRQYKIIFNYLNPNNQGKLTILNILKLNLEQRLYKILMPIIIDIDSSGFSIGFAEFCEKMDLLVKFLNEKNKNYLFSPNLSVNLKYLNSPKPQKNFTRNRNLYSPTIQQKY